MRQAFQSRFGGKSSAPRLPRAAQTMPPKRDKAWTEHTTSTEQTVDRKGIEVLIKGWQCNHCKETYWNTSLQRLLMHLTAEAIRCDKIAPCTKAPAEVRADAVARLTVADEKKATAKRRADSQSGVADAQDAQRAVKVQQRLKTKTVEACEVDGALSDFFDGAGLGHSLVWACAEITTRRRGERAAAGPPRSVAATAPRRRRDRPAAPTRPPRGADATTPRRRRVPSAAPTPPPLARSSPSSASPSR